MSGHSLGLAVVLQVKSSGSSFFLLKTDSSIGEFIFTVKEYIIAKINLDVLIKFLSDIMQLEINCIESF